MLDAAMAKAFTKLPGLLIVLFLGLGPQAWAQLHGTVVGVDDGDTIRLLDGDSVEHELHLYCTDAPELDQPYGSASQDYLAGLIQGRQVQVHSLAFHEGLGDAGMVVLRGADINFRMIRAGYAWYPPAHRCGTAWNSAQRRARESGRGLWIEPAPVPPWEYQPGAE